jgi:hypothetical protein
MFMRFAKVLCMAVLVAMSAATVKAGSIANDNGTDPSVTINRCPKCDPIIFGKSVQFKATPLDIPFADIGMGIIGYEYEGPPASIKDMWVEITGIPVTGPSSELGEPFYCNSDIFVSTIGGKCIGSGALVTSSGTVLFELKTKGMPMQMLDSGSIIGINVSGATPEPSTLLLFLSLAPAIGFAKKRWSSRQPV